MADFNWNARNPFSAPEILFKTNREQAELAEIVCRPSGNTADSASSNDYPGASYGMSEWEIGVRTGRIRIPTVSTWELCLPLFKVFLVIAFVITVAALIF